MKLEQCRVVYSELLQVCSYLNGLVLNVEPPHTLHQLVGKKLYAELNAVLPENFAIDHAEFREVCLDLGQVYEGFVEVGSGAGHRDYR